MQKTSHVDRSQLHESFDGLEGRTPEKTAPLQARGLPKPVEIAQVARIASCSK